MFFSHKILHAVGGLVVSSAGFAAQASLTPVVPAPRAVQVIAASADAGGSAYLAFPAILRTGPDEVLMSFKHGAKHGGDPEADLELVRFDTARHVITQRQVVAHDPGFIHQMGEWVRFPNGDIAVYLDVQTLGDDGRNYRSGMRENRSRDGGRTFEGLKVSPRVDGREYGYPFDFIVQGNTTYMLVMAFGYRPGERWSVDVIQSVDNGRSWTFVRNLKEEFGGHRINESAFVPWEDGFLVTTRAYGDSARLYRTDKNFRRLAGADLSQTNAFIQSHLGRPRLFVRDGAVFLLGRNWRTLPPQGKRMELGLFQLDPKALQVTRWFILDNAERANVTDGYYAVPYFQERGGQTLLNLIDYRAFDGKHPDIIRHEFDWADIRGR
ncbi:MAG: exo-alpha-sialidase [Opitutus sp.]|nr:exo-alpha-sialidase [Opitutus sp.]